MGDYTNTCYEIDHRFIKIAYLDRILCTDETVFNKTELLLFIVVS